MFADFQAKNMFSANTVTQIFFSHTFLLKPSLSQLKKVSVQKPRIFAQFVLVFSDDHRILDLNLFKVPQKAFKYVKLTN